MSVMLWQTTMHWVRGRVVVRARVREGQGLGWHFQLLMEASQSQPSRFLLSFRGVGLSVSLALVSASVMIRADTIW